jgi:hypothetical protein
MLVCIRPKEQMGLPWTRRGFIQTLEFTGPRSGAGLGRINRTDRDRQAKVHRPREQTGFSRTRATDGVTQGPYDLTGLFKGTRFYQEDLEVEQD